MKRERRRDRRRSPNLSDADIEAIVELFDGWQGRMTWPLLIEVVERKLHARYTRQTLHKHERIYRAFQLRKESERGNPTPERRATSVEMQVLLEENARIKAKNERLADENEGLLEQFVVWASNAWMQNGMDETALSRPLPPKMARKPR